MPWSGVVEREFVSDFARPRGRGRRDAKPDGSSWLGGFSPNCLLQKYAKGVVFRQGVNACINPTWGLLPVGVELLGSRPYQGGSHIHTPSRRLRDGNTRRCATQ